jgi:hypothetical protein
MVAGAMGRRLAVGLGVGLGLGLGGGVADAALLVTTVALGLAVLEQATTTSNRHKIEPIRARCAVPTVSLPDHLWQSHQRPAGATPGTSLS